MKQDKNCLWKDFLPCVSKTLGQPSSSLAIRWPKPGGSGQGLSRAVVTVLNFKKNNGGQALVEYALILPMLLLLIVNTVNFGGFFFGWIAMANAARAGADYAIMGGASAGSFPAATAAQVINLISQDVASLPNSSTLTVNICQNYDGQIIALTGSCSSIPMDPEPTSYTLVSVDTTYTYKPFIPLFQFPSLNIYATIPPTMIHQRAVMRSMQ